MPKTHNTPPEHILNHVQDDFIEPMNWSAAALPVQSTSCEALEPNFPLETRQPSSSEPINHLACSLHTRPIVESEDEDNFVGQDLSPVSDSDSSGYLSRSEDKPEDSHPTGLSAWDALGERFEQDVADMGAFNQLLFIRFFNLQFVP